MPLYRLKEKFWWWEPAYTIQDEQGNNLYSLHRKWFAMDQAMEMKEELQKESEEQKQTKETFLTIRKKLFSMGPVYEVVRRDAVVVAAIKEKRVAWFQQERHVFELADVEYVVEEGQWKHKKAFSIQPTKSSKKNGDQIASVYQKRFDFSGAFWVDVNVDPAYYEGEAMKDMCGTVLAACIIMIEILREHDKQLVKVEQEKRKLKEYSKTMK